VEREYTLDEVMKAVEENRMIEAFGAGTAAIVSPVNGFHWMGKDYEIPLDKSNPAAKAGEFTELSTSQSLNLSKFEAFELSPC